jgi:hypothetical protein
MMDKRSISSLAVVVVIIVALDLLYTRSQSQTVTTNLTLTVYHATIVDPALGGAVALAKLDNGTTVRTDNPCNLVTGEKATLTWEGPIGWYTITALQPTTQQLVFETGWTDKLSCSA